MSRPDDRPGSPVLRTVVSIGTALVILGAATIPMFTPLWVDAAQDRAEVPAWTGFDREDVRRVTGALIGDLVLGPPTFDTSVDGVPVLNETERGHLRDVRTVLAGFAAIVVLGAAAVAGVLVNSRGRPAFRAAAVAAVRVGALALAGILVVLGGVAIVAFDVAFEVFHLLLFSGGNWSFDPATDRLVQLFPPRFWQETALAVGVVAIVLALVVARVARPRRLAAANVVIKAGEGT